MNRPRLVGIGLVVISAISFGSGGLFARPAYAAGIDWLTLMAWRFLLAGALAWAVLLVSPSRRRGLRRMPRRMLLTSIGLGIYYLSNTATYFAGITTTPLSLAALIVYVYPPIVAVLALRFGRPLEGRRAWTALGIAVLGVVLAVGGINAAEMPPLGGLLLVIASPLLYSVWIIMAARHSGETSGAVGSEAEGASNASAVGAVMLSTTGVAYWAICLVLGHPVLPATIPPDAWPGVLGVGVVAGWIAVQAFYAGAQRVGAAQASLLSTVEPLWTIVAAGILLGERLEPIQMAGGALILVGVVLSQTGNRGEPKELPQPILRLGEE
ncbi:MAG TPA: DMT family transporter [Candidatus Limnocylindrales bacterium]